MLGARTVESDPDGVDRYSMSALVADIGAACEGPAQLMGARVVAALRRAQEVRDMLAPSQCMPAAHCYGRHVLHGDPAGRFTILALAWGPGQFSPAHAHHAWCAYAVCENTLTETEYAFDGATMKALPLHAVERHRGYGCFSQAGLDQIHRLGNAGMQPAISLHVYGVACGRVGTHVNRMVDVASS